MLFTLLASFFTLSKFRFITRLRVTATSFVFLAQADDREAIQMHAEPVKERLLHYQLSNLS